jgi:acyl-CoA reductase-like NAD-dependent aldehyde dehydrogenase
MPATVSERTAASPIRHDATPTAEKPGPALARARLAQARWNSVAIGERLAVVRRFRQIVAARAEAFARASAAGRNRVECEVLSAEVLPLLEACRFVEHQAAATLAPRRLGRAGRPFWLAGTVAEIRREPLGLILVIGPGNYPLLLPGVQVLQALVAGNAVVLKPGAGGMAAAEALREALIASGLDPALCALLGESPAFAEAAIAAGVDKVVLTGSAETGRRVLAGLADRLTPAVMELSGVDAAVVRADADLEQAARAVAFGLRLNDGATCIAPRRLVVSAALVGEFTRRLQAALACARSVEFPVSSLGNFGARLAASLGTDARLVCGETARDGHFRGPVVCAVSSQSALLRRAWFGPVALLVAAHDDAEAVRLANDSPYALGASVFSRDEAAARQLAVRLNAGVVTINDLIVPTADPRLPFGGRGHSGFGVTRGREGLLEMTAPKVVSVRRGAWRPHYAAARDGDAAFFAAYARLAHGRGLAPRWQALRDLAGAVLCRRRSAPNAGNATRPTAAPYRAKPV